MESDKLSIQLKKALVRCLVACLNEYISSQVMDMIMKCEKLMAKNSYRSRVS